MASKRWPSTPRPATRGTAFVPEAPPFQCRGQVESRLGSAGVVIVNADDFGYDESANRGIVQAIDRGLVSSTTLMANQPGFEEAVEFARARRLHEHVGVHLVLTSGIPLTADIRRVQRFCDDEGSFRTWIEDARAWRVEGRERDAVARELRAQIERVRSEGLPVTHVDSHHHVHNEWGIGACVVAVCHEYAIPFIRLARNCGHDIGVASSLYKHVFNRRLRHRGLARTHWFGEATDWLHLQASGTDEALLDDFEVMTHPVLNDDGELVDTLTGVPLTTLLHGVAGVDTAVSYSGASRAPIA